MELNELYSRREAAKYAGVGYGRFLHHTSADNRYLIGLPTEGIDHYNGRSRTVYTARMLAEYESRAEAGTLDVANPITPTADELSDPPEELYDWKAAADVVGVAQRTFFNHVTQQNYLYVLPLYVGEGNSSREGLSVCFTRRQLDEYKRRDKAGLLSEDDPIAPTDEERDQVMSLTQATQYVYGDEGELEAMKYHIHTANSLPSKRVGSVRVVMLADLERFKSEKRGPGRPPKNK